MEKLYRTGTKVYKRPASYYEAGLMAVGPMQNQKRMPTRIWNSSNSAESSYLSPSSNSMVD